MHVNCIPLWGFLLNFLAFSSQQRLEENKHWIKAHSPCASEQWLKYPKGVYFELERGQLIWYEGNSYCLDSSPTQISQRYTQKQSKRTTLARETSSLIPRMWVADTVLSGRFLPFQMLIPPVWCVRLLRPIMKHAISLKRIKGDSAIYNSSTSIRYQGIAATPTRHQYKQWPVVESNKKKFEPKPDTAWWVHLESCSQNVSTWQSNRWLILIRNILWWFCATDDD